MRGCEHDSSLTVRISWDDHRRLRRLAETREETVSETVREMLAIVLADLPPEPVNPFIEADRVRRRAS